MALTARPLRIAYAVSGQVTVTGGRLDSPQAGVRYRALIPAQRLATTGWTVEILVVHPQLDTATVHRVLAERDVVVLSCPLDPAAERIQSIARSLGARTVLDLCDNHFVGSRMAESYRALSRHADLVTAVTPELAAEVLAHTGRRCTVIADPVEGPRGIPAVPEAGEPLRVLWFGGATNLDTLPALVRALSPAAAVRAIELTLVTADVPEARAVLTALPAGATGRLVPWSPAVMRAELAACHTVLLPSLDTPHKRVKGANRLVEALWAGRWVIAHPLPAYRDWADAAAVTEDLGAALLASSGQREEMQRRIALGQERIAAELTAERVAARWAGLLESLAGRGLPRAGS